MVKTQAGKLTIEKRDVTLTSATDSKVYDGKPLTNDGVKVSGDGFAEGEGATYTVTGSQTLVGGSPNSFEYTLNEGTDADNYNITKEVGQLTVTARPDDAKFEITVVANSGTETYDGTEKGVSGLVQTEFEIGGVKYTVEGLSAEAKGTDAGGYTANVTGTAVVKDAGGNDVTSQFVVKTQAGKLTIEKRELVVTTESASKVYDGTELTAPGAIEGLIEGDGTFTVTGTLTEKGSTENTYEIDWTEGKDANYTVSENLGTLTVIAQSIDPDDQPDPDDPNKPTYNGVWISDAPSSVIYDGHSHQWAPTVLDKENGDALTYGEDYSVTYTDEAGNEVTDFTNVTGKIIVTITGEGNYTGSVTREYQITPRTVDLIIPTQTKTYDGTADVLGSEPIVLGFAPAAQMDEGFVAGDDLTVTIAPENVKFSQADVHTDGALIADIANVVATGEDAGNYTLRNISGIGSISEHGVEGFTLTASGYAGAYDGQEHAAVSSISVTGQYQPDTEWDLTFALSEDGEYSSEVPVVTNVSDSTTVWVKGSNANYGYMIVSVEAQVTPLTLTVTANNQTKVAGTADPALTSTYTGALPGETPGWTGTIARVPGEAAGTYQIFQNTLGIEDNGAFLASNYALVFVNGTLTITAAPGGGDNPDDGGDDTPTIPTTPTTPGTTTDGGTPTVIEDAPEQPEPEQIDDDENPLAGPSESIDDDGTPLARPTHQDCWVHWLMILGIIVTAIYDVLVLIRRRKFTGTLASFEDEVLNDRNRNA